MTNYQYISTWYGLETGNLENWQRKKRSHLIQNAIAPFSFAEHCV
ncbi:hypothetical protein [Microcoleus sp. D3_18a_C4]